MKFNENPATISHPLIAHFSLQKGRVAIKIYNFQFPPRNYLQKRPPLKKNEINDGSEKVPA